MVSREEERDRFERARGRERGRFEREEGGEKENERETAT